MNTNRKARRAGVIAIIAVVLALVPAGIAFSDWNSGWKVVDPALNGMDMLTVPESYWKDEHTGEPKQPQTLTVWDSMMQRQ